ncbi:hypothetical protein B0H12DRAFT_1234783 [Mycena haematopus]|nr:hypothetical protein B0H12DRAFT_1234783 [Mycena haematopus]
MQLTLILPIFCAAFGLVQALPQPQVDARPLVQIPSVDGMDAFTVRATGNARTTYKILTTLRWADVCTLWPPFNTGGLPDAGHTLVSSLVEPGDFSGNNAATEARVVCAWDVGTTLTDITADVANFVGATVL